MIFNSFKENKSSNTPVVIFGSGPAGISLALELEKKKIKSIIIEAGKKTYNEESQKLYEGKIIGNLRTPLDQSRSRQLGGTSNLWGGWSIPLESYDFNTWPIKEKSLQNFNLRTCEILKIKNQFRKSKLDKFFNQIEFQYSNVRFADDYENQLTISKYINIFLNTQLTHFVGSNKKTSHAICVSNGKRYKINSKYFILACGGIENSRILLWTKEKSPSLIDNNLPIGKYWMTHPWILAGKGIIDKENLSKNKFFKLIDYEGPIHFAASNNFLQETNLLSAAIYLNTTEDKNFIKDLIKDILCVAPEYGKKIAGKILKKSLKCGNIFMHLEDEPNKNNKISLDKKNIDYFGIPKSKLFYNHSPTSLKTAKKILAEFANLCRKKDYGRIAMDENIFNQINYEVLGEYHHMGGTRMGNNELESVVDKNLLVHNTNNLFVCGSSVFRTSGYSNPTFAIIQLSLRLADHIQKEIKLS